MFSHQNFVDYVNFLNVAMQPLYFWYMCPSKYHNNHSCMEIQLSWRIIWEQNWGYLKTLNLILLPSHILNILLADWFDIVGWTGQNWTGLFLDVHTAPLAPTPRWFLGLGLLTSHHPEEFYISVSHFWMLRKRKISCCLVNSMIRARMNSNVAI